VHNIPLKFLFYCVAYFDMNLCTSTIVMLILNPVDRRMAAEDKKRIAKRLCFTVLHFIEPHMHLGLDIVIQLDNVGTTDSCIIGPLCR
jgi:hypothetical protein